MQRDLPDSATAPVLAALERENALLRNAIERLPLGMSMYDAQDRLVLANARYGQIWDLPPGLAQPGTPFSAILASKRGRELDPVQPPPGPGTRRREWLMDDGRHLEVTVTREADGSCVALHQDVTEHRRNHARMVHLARHDALTGLNNRSVLVEELDRHFARAGRGEASALLCIDLDRFKPVNDSLGHAAGDQVLRTAADRLRRLVRPGDAVVRLGGDEFAVLQSGGPQPEASAALARRIVAALAEPIDLDGQAVHIGASVGVAIAPQDGVTPERLLQNADLALYLAKDEGRGTWRYFEPQMDARAQERRRLEADLRRALEEQQFSLVYQPQMDLGRDGAAGVSGVEALLRWQHPERGLLPPGEFIPLAEETGLIVPIGRWVLAQACQDAVAWPEGIRLAVNVSAVQFRRASLLDDVMQALAASGLPPERLELELTETAMLQETDRVLATLKALRARGVRVAMDDFGTGFSSLSHLRSFPFDRIKIDRSFVRDAASDAETLAIIRAVAGLGRSLQMATTLEGVETAEQLTIATREGCTDVQGFLFSQPVPAAEMPDLLQRLQATPRAAAG